jgi:site-specific recombinase XerD
VAVHGEKMINGSGCGTRAPRRTSPAVNFHAIRHPTASFLVKNGVPLAFVAEMLGHSDTHMVSKQYAHLAKNIVHHEIGTKLPEFSAKSEANL